MKWFIQLAVVLLYKPMCIQQMQVTNKFETKDGSYFPGAGSPLTVPKSFTQISCLIACTLELTSCSGVNVNKITKKCIGFQNLPLVDNNGEFPNNNDWIRFYQGKIFLLW